MILQASNRAAMNPYKGGHSSTSRMSTGTNNTGYFDDEEEDDSRHPEFSQKHSQSTTSTRGQKAAILLRKQY
jgi:hypothetical protein